VIFTCVKMKIATLPLVYKGATLFTPKKLGNLQATCKKDNYKPVKKATTLTFLLPVSLLINHH